MDGSTASPAASIRRVQARPRQCGSRRGGAAKSAFYDGRWRASADAYARWISLEPEASEARFEYAESLRADGRIADADAELQALIATGRHDSGRRGAARAQACAVRPSRW
jgi:hypothetical protein